MNPPPSGSDDPPRTHGRPGVRGAVALGVLGIGVAGFALLSRESVRPMPPPGKPPPVRTRVIELEARDFPVVVRSQAIVRAREEVTLSAQIAGRVARVAPEFDDGAFFEAGDVLLELEADDFRTAVAMAEARVQSTEAAARLAELNQRRDADLLRAQLIPAAQAEVTAATLAQVRADAATASAQLDRARRDLDRTRVRSPFAGCVRRRAVGPGQWVTPGAPLGSVFAVDAVEVRLPVSGSALAFLRLPGERNGRREVPPPPERAESQSRSDPAEPRMEVELEDSLATARPSRWRGRVVRGEQALHADTLERFVIVRVDDPFGFHADQPPLRPGQPVTGFLPGQVLTNVLVLPRVAVRELDRIHLVDPGTRRLSSRRIAPLWADAEQVVVRDASIPDGMLLATTHLVHAPDGAEVEIIPDLAAGAGASTNAAPRGTRAAATSGGRP